MCFRILVRVIGASGICSSQRDKVLRALLFVFTIIGATGSADAGVVLVNGDFEDTSGNFPNGWGSPHNIASVSTMFGASAAQMDFGESISQDFVTPPSAGLANFQLDFAFRTSEAPLDGALQHRIRIQSDSVVGATNLISLSFDSNSIRTFSGAGSGNLGWGDDLTGLAIGADTNYFVRVLGSNFDQPSRSFVLGFSTDGVNYTTTTSTRFHEAALLPFETISFEQNAAMGETLTVDNVAIPEPSPILFFSLFAAAIGILTRRKDLAVRLQSKLSGRDR